MQPQHSLGCLLRLFIVGALAASVLSGRADACQILGPVLTANDLVTRAYVIVRATAVGRTFGASRPTEGEPILFRVDEVLKGRLDAPTLIVYGVITPAVQHSNAPVPRDRGRVDRSGSACFDRRYEVGVTYLLFLRAVNNELTPYWAGFSAVNEQLAATDDDWLIWVRRAISRLRPKKIANLKHFGG